MPGERCRAGAPAADIPPPSPACARAHRTNTARWSTCAAARSARRLQLRPLPAAPCPRRGGVAWQVVDGVELPATPIELLRQGKITPGVKAIMVAASPPPAVLKKRATLADPGSPRVLRVCRRVHRESSGYAAGFT